MPTLRSLFVAFFFAICLFAPGASAADDERAVQLFNQGRDAIVRNDFNKAYAALSEAWKLKQSYDIAALLGQSELQLGKYTAAAEHLSASLRAFPSTGDARKKKAAVEALLVKAKQHVAEVTVTVSQDGADVLLDGAAVGRSPLEAPLYLDAGEHRLSARAHGFEDATETVTARAGSVKSVALQLEAETPKPAGGGGAGGAGAGSGAGGGAAAPGGGKSPDGGVSARTVVLASGAVLTVASAAVAVGFMAKANGHQSDADKLLADAKTQFGSATPCSDAGRGSSLCQNIADASQQRADANRVEGFAWIATGVFATATVATFLLWTPSADHDSARARRFELSPALGSKMFGGTVRARF